jgi:EAL domain-containing protein (putative c-di-GMP-specific phosphodiesterase class I)
MAGADFCIFLTQFPTIDVAMQIAKQIHQAIKKPFKIGNHELFVTCSSGISFYPDDAKNSELLLHHAAAAMNLAREGGGDINLKFVTDMSTIAEERLNIENDLMHALQHNEFLLHYQPIINMKTKQIAATESLLRWQHPQRGLLYPRDFLFSAESSGVIDILEPWILHSACKQTKIWHDMGFAHLVISTNLCARPFRHPDLVAQIHNILKQTGLPPQFLQIEITETIALSNTENTLKVLNDLKKLGIRLAIDDFGTGYSSLSYVRNFPFDTLKIDISFIRDIPKKPANTAIAKAIIEMAHSLNIEVVAEGVETEAQQQILVSQNCDKYQGFLFSPAIPADSITKLFSKTS